MALGVVRCRTGDAFVGQVSGRGDWVSPAAAITLVPRRLRGCADPVDVGQLSQDEDARLEQGGAEHAEAQRCGGVGVGVAV